MPEKNLVEKGPGDYKDKPQISNWTGDSGDSSSKKTDEGKSVNFGR